MRIASLILGFIVAGSSALSAAADTSEATQAVARYRDAKTELKVTLDGPEFVVMEGATGPLPTRELRRLETPLHGLGNVGPEVTAIQTALVAKGYRPGKVDGKFGQRTYDAVVALQEAEDLAVDGTVGDETWTALDLPTPHVPPWRRTESLTVESQGRKFAYRVSPELEIFRHEADDGTVSWSKRVFREVARDERSRWPAFLASLVPLGLQSYEVIRFDQGSFAWVTLRSGREPKWPLGQAAVAMSPEAYAHLRAAKDYPPRPSSSGRYVILVHEPHQNTSGQVQLVEGLDALLRGNKDARFKFLVEGDLSEYNRDIPIAPVRQLLSNDDRIRQTQVHFLLRNYLIDGPLAYRLIYGDVAAVAIDDPKALEQSPPNPSLPSPLETGQLLQSVFAGLRSGLGSEDAAQGALRVEKLMHVDAHSSDKQFVKHLGDLADANAGLARSLTQISPADYQTQIQTLERNAQAYATAKRCFELAVIRTKIMADHVGQHFQGKDQQLVPIAFIGSFHTRGMIDLLPPDVGYVVLEPRISSPSTRDDSARFNIALHNYTQALASAKQQLRKLRVLPPKDTLPDIQRIADRIAQVAPTMTDPNGYLLDSGTTAAVRQAIDRNGFLNNADMVLAGADGGAGGPPKPPSGLGGAFASFEMGKDGAGRKLYMFAGDGREWDASAGARWRARERLDFLRHVVLTLPPEVPGIREQLARKVSFFQDPQSKVVFVSVFDRSQNTFYFFQADGGLDGLSFLALPPGRSEAEIHFRLAELMLRHRVVDQRAEERERA